MDILPTLGDIVGCVDSSLETTVEYDVVCGIPKGYVGEEPYTHTHSGGKFFPLRPEDTKYSVYDISYALARNPRYNGHLDYHYSVAQHCVLVSRLLEEIWTGKRQIDGKYVVSATDLFTTLTAKQGLFHDASEAYLTDVARPIKQQLPDYQKIEKRIQDSIYRYFGINPHEHWSVKYVDKNMPGDETHALFSGATKWQDRTFNIEIVPWPELYAEHQFNKRYNELESRLQTA